jgi:alpha-1,2-mannosyltransferase
MSTLARTLLPRFRVGVSQVVLISFLLAQITASSWVVYSQGGVDFAVYYLAAQAERRGSNIYTLSESDWAQLGAQYHIPDVTPPYRYPPLIVGIVSLFAALPFQMALLVWSALNVMALLLSGLILSQLTARRWVDPVVFIGLTFYIPILTTLYAGQVNNIVLLGLALYLLFLEREQIGAAGLALAAGIMFKPLATPLLAHLAWKRDFRRLGAVCLGLVFMAVVSIALTSPQVGLDYVQNAWSLSTISIQESPVTYPPNQSLLGFFGRALMANEFGPPVAHHPELARILWLGCAGLLLISIAILTWPTQDTRLTFGLETGLVLVTINLIIPVSWYHHAVISIIPLLLTWGATRTNKARLGLVAGFLLISVQGLLWHRFQGYTLLLSLGTYGMIITYSITAMRLLEIKRAQVNPERTL